MDRFKVLSWTYSFQGNGFAVACILSGRSFNDFFASKEQAEIAIKNGDYNNRCECERCMHRIFEEQVLSHEE